MTPVEPLVRLENGHLVLFGRDQPQYLPLPAQVDDRGCVMTEWELTEEEREMLFMGGRVRLFVHCTMVHKGAPMNPLRVEATEAIP